MNLNRARRDILLTNAVRTVLFVVVISLGIIQMPTSPFWIGVTVGLLIALITITVVDWHAKR